MIDDNINLFKSILDRAGEEFYLVRSNGALAYVNEAAAQSLGYTIEEMLKMGVPDFDPFFGPAFNDHLERLKEGDMPSFQTKHIAKDGRHVLKEIKPVYLKTDTDEYVCAFARNITERKRMEEQLTESEEKYRRLIENLQEKYFFYSHNTNGIFTYISPSIANILGYSQEEFLAHYTEYLTDNPINEEVIKHTDLSIRGKQQPSYEVEIFHKDGSIKQLEVIEVPVFNTRGKVIAVEGIAHDITDSKRMFEEMAKKSHELEEVNAAMKVLLTKSAEAKIELEERILANLRDLVLPHLKELEMLLPEGREQVYLHIIKTNIEKITSPFSRSLSLKSSSLAPREIQVADLVRIGKTNKEIAALLNVSKRTVESYRDNLRKKLGLRNKKMNLRSYLQSQT